MDDCFETLLFTPSPHFTGSVCSPRIAMLRLMFMLPVSWWCIS